jgi:hypothetical protein
VIAHSFQLIEQGPRKSVGRVLTARDSVQLPEGRDFSI